MEAIPELDRKGLRQFGFMFGGIIAGLFGVILPWLFDLSYPIWPWVVLTAFLGWGSLAPGTIAPFYILWMRFGLLLNAVMSRIILGVVFYLVVMPTGFVMRLRGKDPMNRNFDDGMSSYRVVNQRSDKDRMEKPF